jgi:hypothetical protein
MKLVLLIATILILSFVNGALIEKKKNIARSMAPEDLALEIEFYGTCQEFRNQILSSVWISKHQVCLPIHNDVAENPDYNELNAHWFCTNKDDDRSVVHFVEIYDTDETVSWADFVVSLVPSTPFRVLTDKTSLARRPNCWVTNDYCNGTNAVVNNCKTNEVHHKEKKHHGKERKFIVSHDRIYITANQQVSNDCKTSVTECCGYITPSIFGGICEHEAPTDKLEFPEKEDKKKGGKGGKKGGKQGQGKAVAEEVVVKEVVVPEPVQVKVVAPVKSVPAKNEDDGEDDSEEQK